MPNWKDLTRGSWSLTTEIKFRCRFGEGLSFDQMLLLHKLEKHRQNPKKMATYLTMFLQGPGREEVPVRAVEMAKAVGLKRDGVFVSFPVNGKYYWIN